MEDKPVSVEEIKKHASEQDCWIVVDDVVWDITEFIPSHPGGNESECYLITLRSTKWYRNFRQEQDVSFLANSWDFLD